MPSVDDRSGRFVEMVGRLAPGVDLQASRVDMERRGQLLAQNYPDENDDLSLLVEPMTGIDADFRGGLALFLSTLLAISLLILLIACLNVTGMVLSRTVSRGRELAVRRALGAPSLRLV